MAEASPHKKHAVFIRMLPAFIRRRIEQRPGLVKILDNIGWLFFDKILRMGVGLLVGVWVARYLGPEQFGLINFALAFTGLFSAVAALGLQSIVVRDLVRDPETAQLTLGTSAILHIVAGLLSYLLIIVTIAYLRPDDSLARSIVAILGAILLLKASDIAVYWFESQVQSKYVVWVQNSIFLLFAIVKVALILNKASLTAFVWLMLAEAIIVALILLIVFCRLGQPLTTLKTNSKYAKSLLIDSWPLLLSSIAIMIYMKIDQIMLGEMIGDEAVGIYSAATRISEIWYFIPMVIVASVFPSIVKAKKRSESEYYAKLQKLYDLMVWISVSIALPMTFMSTPIVTMLFGDAYAESGPVLSVHIWAAIFVFLGVASGKWFLIENLQIISFQRTALGAIANIILNLLFIPEYGALGAAWATLISYAVAAFLSDGLYSKTRVVFYMKIKSFNPFNVISKIIEVRKNRE
jgi:O-antigen/teichoic acid export membrane protein